MRINLLKRLFMLFRFQGEIEIKEASSSMHFDTSYSHHSDFDNFVTSLQWAELNFES
jgi:hypothetical protein